jgi:hypothetical protein
MSSTRLSAVSMKKRCANGKPNASRWKLRSVCVTTLLCDYVLLAKPQKTNVSHAFNVCCVQLNEKSVSEARASAAQSELTQRLQQIEKVHSELCLEHAEASAKQSAAATHIAAVEATLATRGMRSPLMC